MAEMLSIVQEQYGAAPERVLGLARIGTPATGEDEVLVRIGAASVDRGTWHLMAGLPYPIRAAGFGLRRPKYANPAAACSTGTRRARSSSPCDARPSGSWRDQAAVRSAGSGVSSAA
jgi:hypothetical protein